MKNNKQAHPPQWAQRFLEWYCRPELLEDLQGDLNEYFERHCKQHGPAKAKLIYILDVLKFLRIYTIRKPEFFNLLIHWLMLGSYIKTSGRSILRHKLFSFINITGLAVSMSVGLLVIALVSDMLSYDSFHEKKERIFRVNTRDQRTESEPMNLACTSVRAGKKIEETIAGWEEITLMQRGFEKDAVIGSAVIPVSGLWADESFFNVFTFPFIQGDPATALKDPYSLVLTEKSALKLFGQTGVVGKSVKFDTSSYTVTGVMKDIPKLSHMRFEALVSFSTIELIKPDIGDGDFLSWENIYSTYIYLVLPENTDPKTFQTRLDKLSASENAGLQNRTINLKLQPLLEIPMGAHLTNPIGPGINKILLWILGGLASVIIISACFNYTNLSIARSLRRSREIGIRKVIGARKSHIMGQFISESVIIALLALTFSFLLFLFLRPRFLSLDVYLSDLLSLKLSVRLIFWFVTLAFLVGIAAGFLPALFFSRINSIQVLKDASTLKIFRHVSLRKILIVVQYTFSLIFITVTIIGYSQYRGFLTFDLGFTTENILNIKMNGTNNDRFVKELSEIPEVSDVSRSLIITSLGSIYGTQMKYKDLNDSAGVWLNFIDEHYLPLHKHTLLAGRNLYAKPENAEESEAIVNEQVLKRFDIGQRDPRKALGEQLVVDGKKLTIVGVLKDFHYGTLEEKIQPVVLRYFAGKTGGYVNAAISTKNLPSTLSRIEKAWKKADNAHPLEATFYDDQIEEAYSSFSVMIKVIGFLSFLAVCIASIGLFGMVVFTTETRLKEISIRKVLGASEGRLVYQLSKGFLMLLALAALIALPATYLFFEKVVLVNFAYHQPIGMIEILLGVAMVLMLAFLMIGSQTLKAARANPASILKNE